MNGKRKQGSLLAGALLVAILGAGGFWLLRETRPKVCMICERSIHPHSSAVVVIDKKSVRVCCIRCGITHNFQVGKPGEVVEVTEYLSDRPIKPDGAFYVEGSQVSMCDPHEGALLDETKHPYQRVFDRCEPSTYAFAKRADAEQFVRTNGGKLLSWEELRKEIGAKP